MSGPYDDRTYPPSPYYQRPPSSHSLPPPTPTHVIPQSSHGIPPQSSHGIPPPSSHGIPPPTSHGIPPPTSHGIPPTTSHGPASSPERLHSSQGFQRTSNGPGSAGGGQTPHTPSFQHSPVGSRPMTYEGGQQQYATQPLTPMSATTFTPNQQFYGVNQTPTDAHVPSPPTSSGRSLSQTQIPTFTSDGSPIVPVGVSGGKMFQCRGYGDCDKVFTRSEHLARHVRKHTGERPFPCHCGKAFSRLDNLRQHAATVHADSSQLNDAMLNSLTTVHANLSARASKEQRKRGEVVEVPKNAVERPRHTQSRQPLVTNAYTDSQPPSATWEEHSVRPGTAGAYGYNLHPGITPSPMDASSRRPGSATGYPTYPPYFDGQARPTTAPNTGSSSGSAGQYHPSYRPVSAASYQGSESSARPPQSPMYPQVPETPPPHPYPVPHHPPPQHIYHPTDYSQPPQTAYGPPGSGYSYPQPPPTAPPSYYGHNQSWTVHPPPPPQHTYSTSSYTPSNPPESPFQYGPPVHSEAGFQYPQPPQTSSGSKRKSDDDLTNERKVPRPDFSLSNNVAVPIISLGERNAVIENQDENWLPPTSERRSSLAISALLGSPQLDHKPRSSSAQGFIGENAGTVKNGYDNQKKAEAVVSA